jgi:hypothetical protein
MLNGLLSSIWNLIYNINIIQEMRYSERNTVQKRAYAKISLKVRYSPLRNANSL